jgi:hypothetical protein
MKSKLLKLTIAAFVAMTINANAQATLGAPVVVNTFESWSGASPNVPAGWEVAPASTIAAANVTQVTNSNTLTPVQSGSFSCKMVNTASTYTSGIMAGTATNVVAGTGYQISYFARGKGTISCELTDGSAATSSANYTAANGQSVSGKGWHHYYQTVIAPTTTNNAQFALKVKSTGTYTASGGVSITGVDVDSFVVRPYTPIPASLYNIQYNVTTTPANSPFFGQFVSQTGGIVTAVVLSSSGKSGYYVQTSGSNAWAAALVFDQTNVANVAVGDSVTFQCAVDEYFNMTELVQVSNFAIVSHSNPLPSTNISNSQFIADEQYEGVLVTIQNATVQTYSANFGEGTIATNAGVDPPCNFDFKTNFYAPNGSSTSGSSGNPGYSPYNAGTTVVATTPFCVTGNVNYEFSAYNIIPRDSADIVRNCVTLGVEKHNSLNANLYPNPVANELNIQLPFAATKVSVSIIDVMGREMIAPISANGTNVNITNLNLAAGTYFVKITADGKTQIAKIVKQ